MAQLREQYKNEIAPALMKKFGYKSVMQIPKLDKVIINVAAGEAIANPKVIDAIVSDISQITGQKPIVCKAKKSVANFKLREGMPIGVKVTLRGERMYEFVERFFGLALPRVRDFRGINPNSFDGRGNYSMGIIHLQNDLVGNVDKLGRALEVACHGRIVCLHSHLSLLAQHLLGDLNVLARDVTLLDLLKIDIIQLFAGLGRDFFAFVFTKRIFHVGCFLSCVLR